MWRAARLDGEPAVRVHVAFVTFMQDCGGRQRRASILARHRHHVVLVALVLEAEQGREGDAVGRRERPTVCGRSTRRVGLSELDGTRA